MASRFRSVLAARTTERGHVGRHRDAMDPQSDEKSGRILQEAMVHLFPHLADARIDYCWGGLVDMTLDRMVKAGQREGVY